MTTNPVAPSPASSSLGTDLSVPVTDPSIEPEDDEAASAPIQYAPAVTRPTEAAPPLRFWRRLLHPSQWRLSIVATLAISFGSLVVLSVGITVVALLYSAANKTLSLQATNGQLIVGRVSQNLRYQLDPAESQLEALGRYILSDHFDVFDTGRINDLLLGTLAADEQIDTLIFVRSDLKSMSATRGSTRRGDFTIKETPDNSNPMYQSFLDDARNKTGVFWKTPFYSKARRNAVIPLYMPIRRGQELFGVLRATVAISVLSRHIGDTDIGVGDIVPFALSADGYIIAHPKATPDLEAAAGKLLKPDDVGDPVLAAFRPNKPTDIDAQQRFRDLGFVPDFKAQQLTVNGEDELILYKELDSYAPPGIGAMGRKPWIIGLHLRQETTIQRLGKVATAGYFGIAVMLGAVGMAFLIGRRIARPMARLAEASERLARLELDDVPLLRRSRLREVDVAIAAYNRMRIGLSWLATYVPRSLLPQLIRSDTIDDFASQERAVTVLFTDIVGFSAVAQRLLAPDLAAFLNRHFSVLGEAIGEQGGTIDKYIGDSVMAFWGAPARQPDHVQRACRAALLIAERLQADNARRARKGRKPVRVRIGIETGIAIAGNIGAPGRVNYTLVGDSVNLAQRFEQFGKEIDDGLSDAIIVIGADVAQQLPPELQTVSLGAHLLPGRGVAMELYRLLPPTPAQSSGPTATAS